MNKFERVVIYDQAHGRTRLSDELARRQFERERAKLNRLETTVRRVPDDREAQARAAQAHAQYMGRKAAQRARKLGDIAAGFGIVALITAGVALTFLFLWAGFDPGLVAGWFAK